MTAPESAEPTRTKRAARPARKAAPKSAPATTPPRKQINLALQGGGSHGAFTWGVLDRIFEDERLQVVAISGASAGAMNAVVAAQGMQAGGPAGARAALATFWRQVARAAAFSPIRRSPLAVLTGDWKLDDSVGYLAADLLGRLASPYDMNPLNANPLRDLLARTVDFERVRACASFALHVSATDVETGRGRVFHRDEMTLEVVLASACLPSLFHAVEIEGRHYWDGGFMGNPVIWPFYESSPSDDVVIVQINPVVREGVPRTAREIADRVNEITFNGALLKELRAIDFVNRLIAQGRLDGANYRNIRMHMIEARKQLRPLGASSKLNAEWPFLKHLFGVGRAAAEKWLAANFDDLGARQTLDVRGVIDG